jgi:pimeloyl-ACP methyl ester carboxylesterase
MIPSSNARNYESVLVRSMAVVLPHLGHLIQEEQPEQGLAQVQMFLRDPSGAVSMGKGVK